MAEGGFYQAATFYNPMYHVLMDGAAALDAANAGCFTEAGRSSTHALLGVLGTVSAGAGAVRAATTLAKLPKTRVRGTAAAPAAASVAGTVLDDAARIETHLARLDHSPANDAMLARLRAAAAEGRPLSVADLNFMRHELTEAGLMNGGMGYEQAHEIAGQTHPTFGNYDPEVIKQFPELFNQNWRNYWGIE